MIFSWALVEVPRYLFYVAGRYPVLVEILAMMI